MILRTLTLLAFTAVASPAFSQTAVTPAAAETKPQVVRFRQSPAAVGDQVTQTLNVDLGLTTKITQSGQTAHESSNRMRREQQRTIEVTEVADEARRIGHAAD